MAAGKRGVRVVFLVPRRADFGHRDKLWELCKRRWQTHFPDWPIYEGIHTEGPFNRGGAINLAAALADQDGRWDVGIVIDSDVMLKRSQVVAAVKRAEKGYVTWAHLRWREFSEYWTHRTLLDRLTFDPEFTDVDLDVLVAKTNPISWSCCIAFPRETFDDMGGFDERFQGWGYEDGAAESLVRGLYKWDRISVLDGRPADVINLWHPRSAERIELGKNLSTAPNDYIRNGLLGRRYQIAVKRDHAVGDQVGEDRMSPELVEKHTRNLMTQDARFIQEAVRRKMPEASWVDWWPTLEELRDGAKVHRLGPEPEPPTITVVLHTGGTEENWPERSVYLRQSLASLSEQVSGPIVQRVIYSDWGPDHLDDLTAIAQERGFYVAGEGHHGYTGSMQRMWAYLGKRAKGDYIFQAEDDFLYTRPVDLNVMALTLAQQPNLVQLALLRDAFYQDEKETGGILGWPEPAFTRVGENGTCRLEHRLFFTANPSLFRKALTSRPWPHGKSSERLFGDAILLDPRARFAFWGQGEEWVKHIGHTRAGVGY